MGLIALQALLSSLILTALFSILRSEEYAGKMLSTVFIVAIPWYFLHSVHWPNSIADTLVLLSVLPLVIKNSWNPLYAGTLSGLALGAALNFRSDFLFLPIALVMMGLGLMCISKYVGWHLVRASLSCWVVSWMLLVPWALHYHRTTARYSLASSNGGMVSLISLGQLPNNPWGIVHRDEYADQVLIDLEIHDRAWSDSGHTVLFNEFRRHIQEHPVAFAKKTAINFAHVFLGGFYTGAFNLSEDDKIAVDIVKEKVKLGLGLNPNEYEIATYRESGLWSNPSLSVYAWLSMGWLGFTIILGDLFLLASALGMAISLKEFAVKPLLATFAAVILYKLALLSLLQYQPRHVNGLFPLLIPFFCIAVGYLAKKWKKLSPNVASA